NRLNPLASNPPLALRVSMGAAAAASLLLFLAAATMTGCNGPHDAANDTVGSTRTVEKRTVDTPTEKVTTTEVRERDTRYVR
ncbi:MAG: hypothetical protein K2Q09_01975, partial [Phycisphaerales bacterium]|nr:hypothetical protein [Phycisphaerales bacterium]